ncbi:MAG: precorrin-8X methylmutase [Eubacteriales bacterium]|jgi:precorrin-8X/cobalt-precorrin-8 methylmutase
MKIEEIRPADIEKKSFEIITKELEQQGKVLEPGTEMIVKRCIHTSADFDYADNLYFSDGAVDRALCAIRSGASIVTDTEMAKAGISKRTLSKFGGRVYCFMSDTDVAEEARREGVTRAIISMRKAAKLEGKIIFAIGNAPTALLELADLYESRKIRPELIIGVPVGFVNVIASKERIMETEAPCIVARGRKGGSNIAACICNALLYMADGSRTS